MSDDWIEIHRTNQVTQARAVALSIAAMEFDVRATSVTTGASLDDDLEDHDPGPFIVSVRPGHAEDLREVVSEIIDEQEAFEAECRRRERAARRAGQACLLLALGAGVIVLLVVWMNR